MVLKLWLSDTHLPRLLLLPRLARRRELHLHHQLLAHCILLEHLEALLAVASTVGRFLDRTTKTGARTIAEPAGRGRFGVPACCCRANSPVSGARASMAPPPMTSYLSTRSADWMLGEEGGQRGQERGRALYSHGIGRPGGLFHPLPRAPNPFPDGKVNTLELMLRPAASRPVGGRAQDTCPLP